MCRSTERNKNMKRIIAAILSLMLLLFCLASAEEKNEKSNERNGEKMQVVNAVITIKNMGDIKLELYPALAPQTVANFAELVQKGFYNGLIFHRVIKNFMIQGGCPHGIGTGGPGYTIKGEFKQNGFENPIKHERGVISMARTSEPDSAGSQFFICHKNCDFLDGQYAAFGRVTEGIETVDKIAETQTDAGDRPTELVQIEKITLELNGVKLDPIEKTEEVK